MKVQVLIYILVLIMFQNYLLELLNPLYKLHI